uniref:Uncharacterized protein n=1 Tax=Vespula pensylvanica TaxID=30213 RepID=A0A834UDB5_VESPE|nr:hypothetical protein H0235_004791 [Vespula pensylvanica]
MHQRHPGTAMSVRPSDTGQANGEKHRKSGITELRNGSQEVVRRGVFVDGLLVLSFSVEPKRPTRSTGIRRH